MKAIVTNGDGAPCTAVADPPGDNRGLDPVDERSVRT